MNAMSVLLSQNATRQSIQRGNELEADVEGSEPDPYRIWLRFEDDEVSDTDCTCPYNHGGWCKHIVAALLAYDKNPDQNDSKEGDYGAIDDLVEWAKQAEPGQAVQRWRFWKP